MKKKIAILVLCVCLFCSSTGVVASENTDYKPLSGETIVVGLECYQKIPVLTKDDTMVSEYDLERSEKSNVEMAREAVLELNLAERGLSYIEEACLTELEEIEKDSNCTLNEYTVLVPKTRATNPSYYATYYGSLSNIAILMLWLYWLCYIFVIGLCLNVKVENEEMEKTGIVKTQN